MSEVIKYTLRGEEIRMDRPEPISTEIEVVPYDRKMDPEDAVDALIEGHHVLIVDFYSSGLAVLSALKKHIEHHHADQSFLGQRDFRTTFREHSQHILILVKNQKLVVRKAPDIGWLKVLYPEVNEFLLPFSLVQGLNSAWQWYEKGISIPGLGKKIHPFYGTYFPTRFEHLILFEEWLKKYKGEKKSAYDIGIGSGVLSYMLLKHEVEKIYGTDTHPNAIIGQMEVQKRMKGHSKIELFYGDLFAGCEEKADLIVFNPPWLPANQEMGGLDKAIYYDDELFPRFFSETAKHLNVDGKVILIFSNLAQITHEHVDHPIEKELAKGGRFEKEVFMQKSVGQASEKTRRNQNWRSEEIVELWVLKQV